MDEIMVCARRYLNNEADVIESKLRKFRLSVRRVNCSDGETQWFVAQRISEKHRLSLENLIDAIADLF